MCQLTWSESDVPMASYSQSKMVARIRRWSRPNEAVRANCANGHNLEHFGDENNLFPCRESNFFSDNKLMRKVM